MKYFYDTEFLEGPQTIRLFGFKRNIFLLTMSLVVTMTCLISYCFLFRHDQPFFIPVTLWSIGFILLIVGTFAKTETKPTIDLISIGMVSEAGNKFYAISNEFNIREAWNRYDLVNGERVYWIRENVLLKIYQECIAGDARNLFPFNIKTMKYLMRIRGYSKKDIGKQVQSFIDRHTIVGTPDKVELYGYYSAYDHVAFCWLFGKMINLPDGIPMYTKDLKQMIDDKVGEIIVNGAPLTLAEIKKLPGYPTQSNAHSAIDDAVWNMDLYKFILTPLNIKIHDAV